MADYQGRDVFVAGGIPGERVVAEVLRVRRNYVAAQVVEVLQASQHRVQAPCPYYGSWTQAATRIAIRV
jgi:23S rRNA (uracil1939-C5)-methyltransferase